MKTAKDIFTNIVAQITYKDSLELNKLLTNFDVWIQSISEYETKPEGLKAKLSHLLNEDCSIEQTDIIWRLWIEEIAELVVLGELANVFDPGYESPQLYKENINFFKSLEPALKRMSREQFSKRFSEIDKSIDQNKEDIEIENFITVRARKELKERFVELDKEMERRVRGKIYRLVTTVSSVAAVVAISFFIWKGTADNSEIQFSNFENDSKVLLAQLEPKQENEIKSKDLSRGEETTFKGFTLFESQKIINAKSKALEGDYSGAIKELGKVSNLEKSKEVSLMLSLIYLNIEDYKGSIYTLKKVDFNSSNYDEAIIYYLGLSYALNGENEKAKSKLKELSNTDSNYTLLANKLIKKL
jgi:hypothetical protein